MPQDRSRQGFLVHDAISGGRDLKIIAYLEGGHEGREDGRPVESRILCRTSEQSREIARILKEARFVQPEK